MLSQKNVYSSGPQEELWPHKSQSLEKILALIRLDSCNDEIGLRCQVNVKFKYVLEREEDGRVDHFKFLRQGCRNAAVVVMLTQKNI